MAIETAFEWFQEPDEERDPAFKGVITKELLSTWEDVRNEIGHDVFDPVLGKVRAGRFERRSSGAWTQTNGEHELGDYVNLTLEVDAIELSLNVIGWFDPQLEKMERWLRKPAAWKFLRSLENWYLLIFVREAHVGKSGRAVFQGAPGEERERFAIADAAPANIGIALTGMRPKLDSQRQKLALHIRRPWTPAEVVKLKEPAAEIAQEVERWLGPLQEIRLA